MHGVGMDTDTSEGAPAPAPAALPVTCQGWNAPRSATYGGPTVPECHRDAAVALARAVSMVPPGTPISVPQLAESLGDAWEGAERVLETLEQCGVARSQGDADAETVAFFSPPNPAHV